MKKKLYILCILVLLGVASVSLLNTYTETTKQEVSIPDYKDATYTIEGIPVHLVDGVAETPLAPDSASVVITRYFGNEVWKDLNNDGVADVTFILTQETGGSGTFYYVVSALKTSEGYRLSLIHI